MQSDIAFRSDIAIDDASSTAVMEAINNSAAPNKEEDDDQVVSDELEVGDDNDPFERLGDETIVEILVRVDDDKSLRRCILLNKRMSCLVPLADPVSIHIPQDPWSTNHGPWSTNYDPKSAMVVVGKLFLPGKNEFPADYVLCDTHSIYDYKFAPVDRIVQYYIKTASKNLRSQLPVGAPIQHVTVKLPPLDKTVFGDNCRECDAWKLEYSGVQKSLIKSCTVVGYFDLPDLGRNWERICCGDTIIGNQSRAVTHCLRFGAILRPMVEQMVREHETLCRVSIVTECGYGRLHIGPKEIRNMRRWVNNKSNETMIMNPRWTMKLNMKYWYCEIGLLVVTDPESCYNIDDVKIVINSALDHRHYIMPDYVFKMIHQSEVMKNKKTLPCCNFQVTNSEWQWKCDI